MSAIFLLGFAPVSPVYAQGIIPKPLKDTDCQKYEKAEAEKAIISNEKAFKEFVRSGREYFGNSSALSDVLGCAVKLGRIRLFMMPFFITYIIQFLLQVAGLVAVLFVVLGGYKYAVGGLIEDKEAGKKYILHALVGLIVALSAWMVVNFIQIALTS